MIYQMADTALNPKVRISEIIGPAGAVFTAACTARN